MASSDNKRSNGKLILPYTDVAHNEGGILAALFRKHLNGIMDKVKDGNGDLVEYTGPAEEITEEKIFDECVNYVDSLKNNKNNADVSKLTKATLFGNIRSKSLTWKSLLFIMLKVRKVKRMKFTMEVTNGAGEVSKHSISCRI